MYSTRIGFHCRIPSVSRKVACTYRYKIHIRYGCVAVLKHMCHLHFFSSFFNVQNVAIKYCEKNKNKNDLSQKQNLLVNFVGKEFDQSFEAGRRISQPIIFSCKLNPPLSLSLSSMARNKVRFFLPFQTLFSIPSLLSSGFRVLLPFFPISPFF